MSDYIIPKCLDDSEHYVCAEGYWLPCCAVTGKDKQYFIRNEFDTSKNTPESFHKNFRFLIWADKIASDYNNAPNFCKYKCSKHAIDSFIISGDSFEVYEPNKSTP